MNKKLSTKVKIYLMTVMLLAAVPVPKAEAITVYDPWNFEATSKQVSSKFNP